LNFPFVSRATHDRELADLKRLLERAEEAQRDSHQAALDAMRLHEMERRRFDDLLTRYDALRVQGAVPKQDLVPLASKPPDIVTQSILRKAGSSAQLRKHYFDYVNEQRAQGVADPAIAQAILQGESLNPELDGVLG